MSNLKAYCKYIGEYDVCHLSVYKIIKEYKLSNSNKISFLDLELVKENVIFEEDSINNIFNKPYNMLYSVDVSDIEILDDCEIDIHNYLLHNDRYICSNCGETKRI